MRIQSIALEYHGNVPVLGCHIIYQTVTNVKLSIGYFLQTGNHTKRGRFSASGRSYQHDKLFIFNFQIKIRNYHITFIIYFFYMFKCNICHLFFLLILLSAQTFTALSPVTRSKGSSSCTAASSSSCSSSMQESRISMLLSAIRSLS